MEHGRYDYSTEHRSQNNLRKGASGYVKCVSRKLPANATEVAADWALPLPPEYPPPPPYLNLTYGPDALTLLPMEANPVFLAILIILLLDVASLIFAWRLRVINYKGCFGRADDQSDRVFLTSKAPT